MSPTLTPVQRYTLFPLHHTDWMEDPVLTPLWDDLMRHDPSARFVGGCVRDALLGRQTYDIDLGTTCPAQDLLTYLHAQGYHVLTQGLAFGSLRLHISPYTVDITTLRRDIRTDGRWAEVAYTPDWVCDAQRRDLTINALSMNREGIIFDDVGGLDDLHRGIVRFIGAPHQRIQEDALRILRFVRFHQYYSRGEPDLEAVQACIQKRLDVRTLSPERIGQELSRILTGPHLQETLTLIHDLGLDQALWDLSINLDALQAWHDIRDITIPDDPFRTLLVGLLTTQVPTPRLLASCAWPKHLKQRFKHLASPTLEPWDLKNAHDPHMTTQARDQWAFHAVYHVLSHKQPSEDARKILNHREQTLRFLQSHPMPVTGHDLVALGIPYKNMPRILAHARHLWVDAKGSLSADALITSLRHHR